VIAVRFVASDIPIIRYIEDRLLKGEDVPVPTMALAVRLCPELAARSLFCAWAALYDRLGVRL
jgi:hypothetical protein